MKADPRADPGLLGEHFANRGIANITSNLIPTLPTCRSATRWKASRKRSGVSVLDQLTPEPGAFYVMDRGYLNFERLCHFVLAGAFFVTRIKAGVLLNCLPSRPVNRAGGMRSDRIVWFRNAGSGSHGPDRPRRVSYPDPEDGTVLVFLTNDFDLMLWL